ncbi:MAG TPA: hypothetical protein VMZ90_15425, partial [Vicinamibacterales bacterium]|nr:hypothetical protein [Vicinamibacterales bacterium]
MSIRRPTALGAQRGSRSSPAFILCLMAAGVLALLPIDPRYRDFVLLGGTVAACVLAFFDFAAIWRFFLLVLPVIHLIGGMFGQSSLSLVRFALIGLTGVLLVLSREARGRWQIVPVEAGVLTFLIFVGANFVSATHAFSQEAAFRSITYLEPALFFILSYHVVRRDSANLRQIVRVIAIGGVVVCVAGLVEIQQQRSVFDLLHVQLPGNVENLVPYFAENRFGLGGRISSTIGQPVYAGTYLVIWLVATVGYILRYRRGYLLLLIALLPIAGLLILATGARAPLLAL